MNGLTKYIDLDRFTHSIKTGIACIIGYFLCVFINIPPLWAIITIIVVMTAQIYVGSVIHKSYYRFLGTLIGCILVGSILMFEGNNHIAIPIALGLSTFVFSYLATGQEGFAYTGTLGAATTAIIIFSNPPTLTIASERFFEISLGIFIATLVSQFVLPINARTHLRRVQIKTLQQLSDYYRTALMTPLSLDETKKYIEQDEAIVQTLLKQRQLAKESTREFIGELFDPERFLRTLHHERDLLRAITFMHKARLHIIKNEAFFMESPVIKNFNDIILNCLSTMMKTLESGKSPIDYLHLPRVSDLEKEFQEKLKDISKEEMVYIDGYFFSAEIMTHNLAKLAKIYRIPIYKKE